MCASMAAFTINDTFMKSVTQTLPLFQTIGLRGMIAVVGLLILCLATGAFRFRPNRRDGWLILLRSLADVAATIFFLEALLRMPLANLSAILQALPLLITLAAALVYGDKIGWRRMTAILVGLSASSSSSARGPRASTAGRSLASPRSPASWSATCPSAAAGPGPLDPRRARGGGRGHPDGLDRGPLPGLAHPTGGRAVRVLGAGLFLIVGYLTSVAAMRHGDIGLVAPFRYTSLLWAIVLGLLVFGDLPDVWTLLGAAIVVAAGLFTLWRERRIRLEARQDALKGPHISAQ
jgi:drug/metabolite transporter (DMT)-like permease